MEKSLHNITRVTIVDQVIQKLQEYIIENNLKPGHKMPTEKELCEMMGIGRSTAREAYRMLKAMNYITTVQGKGVFLSEHYKSTDPNEAAIAWFNENGRNMTEFMEVRMAIEPMAVKLAIPRATEHDIQRLEETHKLFEHALKEKNRIGLLSYDELFHQQIMDCTRNQLLIQIGKIITECFRTYRSNSFSVEDSMGNALEPHAQILEAFKTNDAQSGYNCMIRHLEISLEDIQQLSK